MQILLYRTMHEYFTKDNVSKFGPRRKSWPAFRNLLSGTIRKSIISLSRAEFVQRMIKVNRHRFAVAKLNTTCLILLRQYVDNLRLVIYIQYWVCYNGKSAFCIKLIATTTIHITKTRLFKYIENFTSKNWKFSDRKTLIFFILLLKT